MKTSKPEEINPSYPVCLIISEDAQEREELLSTYFKGDEVLRLNEEHFSQFGQEVETVPMFVKRHAVHLSHVEKLKKEEIKKILSYLKQPNERVALCLTATNSTDSLIKAIDKVGVVFQLPKEKPWEKERRIAESLSRTASLSGVVFPTSVAIDFVKAFGTDKTLLCQELEKIICYVGEKKEVTHRAIQAVSIPLPQQTIWQLSDAIFALDFKEAHSAMRGLLEEGLTIFPILGSLRTQGETALKTLTLLEKEGPGGVQKAFPYLKGKLLERKLMSCRRFGRKRLINFRKLLFLAEVEARNTQHSPTFILEKFIAKVT
ncbi:MAG: hypothetical protein S4CHLAM45_09180 [Chlamydiales bacterium]|nr:hypothetical protein [Chlamydiales bacterium]MCH9620519.1 hypothetical protein [Chlamydiales bacterium]MCH9623022.1 hypothetical protein [Chlamydiales bacterium]